MKRFFIQANEQEILVVRKPEGIYTLPEYPTDDTKEHLKETIYVVDQIKQTNKDTQTPRDGEIKTILHLIPYGRIGVRQSIAPHTIPGAEFLSLEEILKLHEEKKFDLIHLRMVLLHFNKQKGEDIPVIGNIEDKVRWKREYI